MVAHSSYFLVYFVDLCPVRFGYFHPVSYVPNVVCVSVFSILFSLTFIYTTKTKYKLWATLCK
jgi:hypothetical protein